MGDQTSGQLFDLVLAWAFALLFTAVGALVVVSGVRDGIRLGRLRRRGIRTTAVVVGHERNPGRGFDRPVLQFTDQRGRRQAFTFGRPTSTFVPVGRQWEVVYLPDRPEDAAPYRSAASPLQRLVPVLVGAVFLVAGLATAIGGGRAVHLQLPPSAGEVGLVVTSGLWLLGIGICWFVALSSLREILSLRRNGIRTTGTVEGRGSRMTVGVEFTDVDGRTIRFTGHDRSSDSRVPVLYRESAPEHARIDALYRPVRNLVFLFFISLLVAFAVWLV